MKKLLFTALLFTSLSNAQSKEPYVYFTANADLRNATIGSDATDHKAQLNSMFKFGMTGQGFEVAIGYEMFPALDYERYFVTVGKMIDVSERITVVPSIEGSIIGRKDDWGGGLGYHDNESSHLTVGVAIPVRYHLSDTFALEMIFDAIIRTDDMAKYRDSFKVTPSARLGIVYKINL